MVCIEIERLYCLGPNVPDFANVEATEFDKCELLVGFQKVEWGRGESGRSWGKWTFLGQSGRLLSVNRPFTLPRGRPL